jgi:hypothetical protein
MGAGNMNLKERMLAAGPIWKDLASALDAYFNVVKAMAAVVFAGQNPHKENDTSNTVAWSAAGSLDDSIELAHEIKTDYEAHRASTTYHSAADGTNTIAAASLITTIMAILNEMKTDFNAHIVRVATCHTNDDDLTVQASATATDRASSITLVNQLRTEYEDHRVRLLDAGSAAVHGSADTVNVCAVAAVDPAAGTWSEVNALAAALKTQYEAHRVRVASSCHAGTDAVNVVSASAVTTIQTALDTILNEEKTDFNAHIQLMTSHLMLDKSMLVTVANSSSAATAIALSTALRSSYNDHISRGAESSAYAALPALTDI